MTEARTQANVPEIARTMRLFVPPGQLGEVRIIPTSGGTSGFYFRFDQIEQAAQLAATFDRTAKGLYLVMNEIDPATLGERKCLSIQSRDLTKDIDITRRRWVLIDFDPASPDRGANDSSTDDEKSSAMDVRETVYEYLRGHDFPEAVFADSGNGSHLLFRVDMPNDGKNDKSHQLVESLLNALAKRFSTDQVSVDISVHNAARITKLYGTTARKGLDRPDRPHRISTLQSVPDSADGIVTRDIIESVLLELGGGSLLDDRSRINGHTDGGLIAGFVAIPAKLILPETFPVGGRHDTLLKVAGAVRSFGANEIEIAEILRTINRTRCGGGKPDDELQKIARDYALKDCNLPMKALIECQSDEQVAAAQRQQSVKLTLQQGLKRLSEGRELGEVTNYVSTALGTITADTAPRFLIRWAGDLMDEFPEMSPAILEGLLRCGETMNIIAAPKTGKSWLSMGLGLSVVSGRKWLGRFWTRRGKVLIVDNELNPRTSADRLPCIAEAMGIQRDEYAGCLAVANVRGQLIDLNRLAEQLIGLEPGEFSLIILDAWYRFQPTGSDENSNGDVTQLYNLLDSVADKIGSAFVCIHHSSKGNQSGKGVTDVGSGAGAQSRAPDSHLTIRQHEEDGAVVVEAAVRSFAPMEPFCLRWNFPVWTPADDLDPKELRQERPRKKPQEDVGPSTEESRDQKERAARLKVLEAYEVTPDGNTESKLSAAAGMNSRTFAPIQADLLRNGLALACKVKKNNGASYDGFTLSQTGWAELRQLRQLRQNEGVSDLSDTTPTAALSLESGVSRSVVSEPARELSDSAMERGSNLFQTGGQPA